MWFIAIDQGNTRTKFALFQDRELRQTWVTRTEKTAGAADLGAALFGVPDLPRHIGIGLCSVVPELRSSWQEAADAAGCSLTVITGASPTPLTNAYATPETLGPDRLMAAVAAADLVGVPVIPVSLGTASVVDAVAGDGRYLGGMIAPGIGIAATALSSAASGLWPVEWEHPRHPIGRTSDESMRNGLFYQSIGGIQAMVRAVRDEIGESTPVALTGGWAESVAPHLARVALMDDALVLRGVAIMLLNR